MCCNIASTVCKIIYIIYSRIITLASFTLSFCFYTMYYFFNVKVLESHLLFLMPANPKSCSHDAVFQILRHLSTLRFTSLRGSAVRWNGKSMSRDRQNVKKDRLHEYQPLLKHLLNLRKFKGKLAFWITTASCKLTNERQLLCCPTPITPLSPGQIFVLLLSLQIKMIHSLIFSDPRHSRRCTHTGKTINKPTDTRECAERAAFLLPWF